jgi:hypothetical protein
MTVKVDADLQAAWGEFVEEQCDKKYGEIGRMLENAMREYMNNDRYARMDAKIDAIARAVNAEEAPAIFPKHKQSESAEDRDRDGGEARGRTQSGKHKQSETKNNITDRCSTDDAPENPAHEGGNESDSETTAESESNSGAEPGGASSGSPVPRRVREVVEHLFTDPSVPETVGTREVRAAIEEVHGFASESTVKQYIERVTDHDRLRPAGGGSYRVIPELPEELPEDDRMAEALLVKADYYNMRPTERWGVDAEAVQHASASASDDE